MIAIDIVKPLTYHGENWAKRVPTLIDAHMKYEKNYTNDPTKDTKAPVYSEPDALNRMMEAHGGSLNIESARILMARAVQKQNWGLTFRRDIRYE